MTYAEIHGNKSVDPQSNESVVYAVEKGTGMVEITVSHEHLLLEVEGMHKLWALKSRLDIPLAHIKSVHADPYPAMG